MSFNNSLNVTGLLNCSLLDDTESSGFEWFIRFIKIVGILLQIIFFIFIFTNKSFNFRPTVFLLNLSIVNFLSSICGLLSFKLPALCKSQGFCTFQGLLSHLCMTLYAFGMILLAKSRLMCVLKPNLVISKRKILFSLIIAWTLPITNLIMLKVFSNLNLDFNKLTLNCMLNFSDKKIYMWILISINCIFPGISIATVFYLIYRFIQKKNRVEIYDLQNINTISKNNMVLNWKRKKLKSKYYFIKELKLLILLTIIYIGFEIHACAYIINITQLESDSDGLLMTLRSFKWIILLLNPIFYFKFYRLMIQKLKKSNGLR